MAENNAMTNQERLKEITDGIELGIQGLFQSDRYMQYLRTMSHFHKYSVNNQMLIYMQNPNATRVAGYNKWRDQFGRQVNRGEKSIEIIAPTPYLRKIETEKIDPDTQRPVLNPDGTVVTEEKEIRIPRYKPVKVFDVSQTFGKPIPSLAADLTGNVERYELFFEAVRRASPVPISIETMAATMDGNFSPDRQDISVRNGMSEVQTVCAAIHEITHAKLHNYEQIRIAAGVAEDKEPPVPKDRQTEEVEAESVSYAVCQYYGIETGENSLGYISDWSSDKTLPELRSSLETINKTASGLISDISQHYREVIKEYDVVLEAFAADCDTYLRENLPNPYPFATHDEAVSQMVEDIKCGDARYARANILRAENEGAPTPDDLLRRLNEIEKVYPPREIELLYLLDNSTYLYIQEADTGYDYTLYDRETLREIDGGHIDEDTADIAVACNEALNLHNLTSETSEKVSMDIIDDIRSVREQDMAEYKREHNIDPPASAASPVQPESPELASEYPMPDPDLSMDDFKDFGYMDDNMLPLSQDRALALLTQDMTVYLIYDDNTESMVFDTNEIYEHQGVFGVEREDWERTAEYEEAVIKFRDLYEIYQVKQGSEYRDFRFEPYKRIQAAGLEIDSNNYEQKYSAHLDFKGTTEQKLDGIFHQFNLDRPADFTGHSLSVSDIIALRQDGEVTYHYCDGVGFQELPGFNSGKNPLRSIEDIMEQNDNQLDGVINNLPTPSVAELEAQVKTGQSISLMDLARATHAEKKEKRTSVLEKLKQQAPTQGQKKTAPVKGAEMGR